MRLDHLVSILDVEGAPALEVTGIQYDSRQVKPGDVFVAIKGLASDGHAFIDQAVKKGAAAVICRVPPGTVSVPVVLLEDTRKALPLLAAQFFGHPSKELRVVGVTGTSGKTTTTSIIRHILVCQGHRTGLLGTIENIVCDQVRPSHLTTPESVDMLSDFAEMVRCDTKYAVMEVSSHSLSLGRVDGIEFDIAVYTNLSQDHLDYHLTMDNYRAAKGMLFERMGSTYFGQPKKGAKACVINVDDASSDYMRSVSGAPVVTYAIDHRADVRAVSVSYDNGRARYRAITPMGEMELRLRLAGRINVYNTLAAIAACVVDRVPLDVQKAALESFGEPPGRFERVDAGQDFTVIVDYAHKPDGLMNVLRASRDISKGRVIVLFGCGGDRDRLKRPLMGRIAGELADLVIITSDNPRSEDPEAILDDIEVGLKEQPPREGYVREADREAAIRQAMESARPGDVVMLAGKGHETYQIFRDRTIHFDDKEAARRVLGEMRMSRPELFR